MKEEGRGGGSELGSYLDLYADPWKILCIRIRIRQIDADPLDPDPQHGVHTQHSLETSKKLLPQRNIVFAPNILLVYIKSNTF